MGNNFIQITSFSVTHCILTLDRAYVSLQSLAKDILLVVTVLQVYIFIKISRFYKCTSLQNLKVVGKSMPRSVANRLKSLTSHPRKPLWTALNNIERFAVVCVLCAEQNVPHLIGALLMLVD